MKTIHKKITTPEDDILVLLQKTGTPIKGSKLKLNVGVAGQTTSYDLIFNEKLVGRLMRPTHKYIVVKEAFDHHCGRFVEMYACEGGFTYLPSHIAFFHLREAKRIVAEYGGEIRQAMAII